MEFSKKDLYPRSEAELIKHLRRQLEEKVKIIDDLQDIILDMSKKNFKKQVIMPHCDKVSVKKVTDNIPALEPLKQFAWQQASQHEASERGFKLRPHGLPNDVLRVKPNNELISDANFETLIKDLQFDW